MKTKSADQLGMDWAKARYKLSKMLLFKMAHEAGYGDCFQCGRLIDDIDTFSVDHKQPWRDVDAALFWDLNNIAFSHLSCNSRAAKRGGEPIPPIGDNEKYCGRCKNVKQMTDFPPAASRRDSYCTACQTERVRERRQRTGKR